MEATEEAEPSDHAIILQDGAKHSPSETSQRGQSWRSEGTVGPQEERDNPPADMGSQVLASGNTLKCHIQLRQKKSTQSAPPPESDAKTSDAPQRKSIKAGKYVCQYCGRACAKPSVLKKHIRSHTGERPYPCVPCGFSFKTKSNLYKHRKSHTHAVKAGLASFSGRGEKQEIVGEMHSDAGQSSESDEDVLEEATESQITASGRNEKPSHKSETTSPGKVSLWQFRERLPPVASAHVDQMIEFSTIKQRLALRLSEKKSHESEASLSLPGSYSKSSTDSGYFSRSDSAEQQLHPANSSAKSYQEIMFGKCYRPSAKKSITVQSCTTDSSDSTPSFTIKPSRSFRPSDADRQGLQKDLVTSGKAESFQEDDQQHLLEASDGVFLRSNSLPSSTSLDAAQALRSTHSFDERMTAADASCRGAAGMRRLRRQAAFEHCTNECDCHSPLTCSLKSDSLLLSGDDSRMTAESHQDMDQCALSLWPDSSTRKRRKDKAGTDEEDLPTSHSSRSSETAVETACSEAEGRERRNVISVIQHTNSLISSRTSPDVRSCSAESELCGGGWRIDAGLKFQKQLFSQTSITVPEIRVTVEPDRPKKLLDVAVEPKDKHVEEFQWPQRSQTLSQFPVEKLPPKKKRLRLAEMECSSGESSFESACTSLSRSPSQDSNLSHGSGFSQSQERDETHNVTSQTEEASKPLELLSVPGCSAGVHREMRRSASEQAPHKTAPEVAGLRSKSVDLGSLSASWPGDIAERQKVFLIRQATLSESATPDTFSPGETMMKRTASHMLFSVEAAMEKTTLSLLDNPFHQHKPFVQGPEQAPIPKADALHDLDHVRRLLAKEPAEFRSVKPFVSLSGPRSDCSPSVARVLSAIAQQASVAQASSGVLVPVRIQMQVPLYGNITYTSISHILESQTRTEQDTPGQSPAGGAAHPPAESPAKLKTGFPLSLTSKTISTTEAPSGGASKRMLSPASSLELVSKQQKRIKEDNIYGQIVKELSAVGLGNPEDESPQTSLIPEDPSDVPYLPGEVEMDEVLPDSFTNPQRCPRSGPGGDAVMEPAPDDPTSRPRSAPSTVPSVKAAGALFFSKLPGLHTSAHVSWCFLSCPKPNSWQTSGGFSEYSSWLVKSQNPNPLDLSTATVLALLRSKQAKQSLVYSVASMCQPGLLVTAIPEKRKQGHVVEYNEEDPKREVRLKETSQKGKSSREDVSSATRQQEQARVKICEGGYKSSEEYVYVRGRGRGKYICEECGIRCKKPSMLKKHIRTHTDVRPYVCKCCNFAFKTKGNLTKHMKSKAHVKKCLELGVEQTEEADENQKTLSVVGTSSKRQFSDVEDSDGADEDGEEPDDDEDEEDDGDSTPKTLSRSTSPQLGGAIRSGGLSEALTTRLTPGGPSSTFEDDLERWSASVEPCPPHLLSSRRDSPGQLYVQPPLLLPDTLTAPSPRGDSSPTRQPSPSPLGHQRCLLRAVSPRRASCQPKSPGDQRRSVRVPSATAGDRRSDPGDQSTSVKSDIFSHLPLHSQGQVPTTAPMMPIGGLRMPSTCPSAAPAPHEETARPHPPTDLDLRDKEGLCFCEQAIASLTLTSGEAAGSPQNS